MHDFLKVGKLRKQYRSHYKEPLSERETCTLYSVSTSSICPEIANTTYFSAARERARDWPAS
jgi:hypothetical protein